MFAFESHLYETRWILVGCWSLNCEYLVLQNEDNVHPDDKNSTTLWVSFILVCHAFLLFHTRANEIICFLYIYFMHLYIFFPLLILMSEINVCISDVMSCILWLWTGISAGLNCWWFGEILKCFGSPNNAFTPVQEQICSVWTRLNDGCHLGGGLGRENTIFSRLISFTATPVWGGRE